MDKNYHLLYPNAKVQQKFELPNFFEKIFKKI